MAVLLAAALPVQGAWMQGGPGAPSASAQPPEATPEPPPELAAGQSPEADIENLQVIVVAVQGIVQVRTGEDQPWQTPVIDMVLSPGAEFRTGPRSMVQFVIPPSQVVTLDRLGTVKVIQAIREPGKITTNLGMKYGRTQYQVEAAGIEHDSKITSPAATLAVRGTVVSLYDQPPFTSEAVSYTGRAQFTNLKRQTIAFGGTGRQSRVRGDDRGSAETAREDSFVDPGIRQARTESDREILLIQSLDPILVTTASDVISCLTAFLAVDFRPTITVEENRTRQTPGELAFDMNWIGAADLDLSIISPLGERLATFPFELGPNGQITCTFSTPIVPSGGRIDFDDFGPFDPVAPLNGGRETAYWPQNPPTGVYQIGVSHSGGTTAQFTVDVLSHGSQIASFSDTIGAGDAKIMLPITILTEILSPSPE
jgi:hypothetical protein